jgi:hypothetical protein
VSVATCDFFFIVLIFRAGVMSCLFSILPIAIARCWFFVTLAADWLPFCKKKKKKKKTKKKTKKAQRLLPVPPPVTPIEWPIVVASHQSNRRAFARFLSHSLVSFCYVDSEKKKKKMKKKKKKKKLNERSCVYVYSLNLCFCSQSVGPLSALSRSFTHTGFQRDTQGVLFSAYDKPTTHKYNRQLSDQISLANGPRR